MFLLRHSAPHYFREPIAHRFESRCHTIARQFVTFVYPNPSLDIFIMGGKWGNWKTHTHTPKHPESRNVDLDPSLPSCRRQKNGPWNDIPMARVATLGRGGLTFYLWRQPEKGSMYKVHILLFLKGFNSQDRRVRLQRRSNLITVKQVQVQILLALKTTWWFALICSIPQLAHTYILCHFALATPFSQTIIWQTCPAKERPL